MFFVIEKSVPALQVFRDGQNLTQVLHCCLWILVRLFVFLVCLLYSLPHKAPCCPAFSTCTCLGSTRTLSHLHAPVPTSLLSLLKASPPLSISTLL